MVNNKENLAGCIVVLAVPLCIVYWVFNGWVIHKLWEWLIVPQFNVEPITVLMAMSAALMIGFFVPNIPATKDENAAGQLIGSLLKPFVVLFLGYILSFWV